MASADVDIPKAVLNDVEVNQAVEKKAAAGGEGAASANKKTPPANKFRANICW